MEGKPIRKKTRARPIQKNQRKNQKITHRSKTHAASILANPRLARPSRGSRCLARPRPAVGLQTHGLLLSPSFGLSRFQLFFL
jgi:hypothetical protein